MPKYELTDTDVSRIRQMWQWLTHFSGVTRSPFGMAVAHQPQPRGPVQTPSKQQVSVKITGDASGGGQYTGRILIGSCTADGTGNLTMPEGMTVPDADDCLVLNYTENGKSTHDLEIGGFHVGHLLSGTVQSGAYQGYKIVAIRSLEVLDCSGT